MYWYLLPVLIIAAGVAWFSLTLQSSEKIISQRIADLKRYHIQDGQGPVIEIDQPGVTTFYYETLTIIDGETLEYDLPEHRIILDLMPESGGQVIEAANTHWQHEAREYQNEVYRADPYHGFAAWQVNIPAAGTYQLSAKFTETPAYEMDELEEIIAEQEGENVETLPLPNTPPTLAVAQGMLDVQDKFLDRGGSLFRSAAGLAIGFVLAVAIALFVYAKRNPAAANQDDSKTESPAAK